jgi:hypothetical protein
MENFDFDLLLPYERWIVYFFFGLMAVIAFQVS